MANTQLKTLKLFFLAAAGFCVVVHDVNAQGEPIEFFVATDGNDSNVGSLESPFLTVYRAQSAVRVSLLR